MKCPHCGQEHPDDFKFCSETGKPISQLKACTNPDCPDFGKHILPLDAKFCPRCGHKCENTVLCDNNTFSICSYKIVLGKTTVAELEEMNDISLRVEKNANMGNSYYLTDEVRILAKNEHVPIEGIYISNAQLYSNELKEKIGIRQPTINESALKKICLKNKWQFKCISTYKEEFFVFRQNERTLIHINNFENIFEALLIPKCPHCNNLESVKLESIDDTEGPVLRCKHCRRKFSFLETFKGNRNCPNCGSDDFDDDASGYIQYTCNKCGYIWGDDKD